jgi:hypothetical protein
VSNKKKQHNLSVTAGDSVKLDFPQMIFYSRICPIAGFTRNPTDGVSIKSKGAGETASGYHIRKSWGKDKIF